MLVSLGSGASLELGSFLIAWSSKVLLTTIYNSFSVAESRMWIGRDLFFFWLLGADRRVLGLFIFFSSATAGTFGITVPERGRGDGPVGSIEIGFALAAVAGA